MSSLEQYLVFQLGESYGIVIQSVVEVLEVNLKDITRIPRTPNYMTGIINNRGKLVPVINLRLLLGMEAVPLNKPLASIVILTFAYKGEEMGMGILVDSVKEVCEFLPHEIEPKPSFGTKVQPGFVKSMGNKGGSFTILLDIERIFNVEMLSNLQNTTVDPILLANGAKEVETEEDGVPSVGVSS